MAYRIAGKRSPRGRRRLRRAGDSRELLEGIVARREVAGEGGKSVNEGRGGGDVGLEEGCHAG